VLANVQASATGFAESLFAPVINSTTLNRVATPTVSAGTPTSSSVTFNITNNDSAAASFVWILRQGSSTGTQVASDTTTSIASGSSVSVGGIGLSASTQYWLTNVQGSSPGKTISLTAAAVSSTTTTPPPSFPFFPPRFGPFFPPFFPPQFPFFPPFFPPQFPFFPPNFGPSFSGCLDINTPIHMYDGTVKILKDVEIGDVLLGYYVPGMIHESIEGWQD
jgi:hypothetical protein